MTRTRQSILVLLLFLCGTATARAADWQFSVAVPGGKSCAWLWIPPNCQQVRGIILGQQVILEKTALDDPIIRTAAADAGLAEVIVCPGFDTTFNYDKKNGEKAADVILQHVLNDLAEESGYTELSTAPLLPIGHSGAGIFCWNLAYWAPQRVIGIVTLHSAPILPPAWDPKANVDGIPVLADTGQYESWTGPDVSLEMHWRWVRGELLYLRALGKRSLMSMVVEPGAGHFSWSDALAKHVALFIRKAAAARLSADAAGLASASTQPATLPSAPLRELALSSGWLTDHTLLTPSHFAPASYEQFANDSTLAFWHVDEELARATESFESSYKGKADQRLTFVQDGKPVPSAWIEKLEFHPIGDGMTVQVAADFLDKTPAGVADSGKPLGHSRSGSIRFRLIGGWAGGGEQVGPDQFRIRFSHFGITHRADNLMVMAYHEGDESFGYAEQPASISIPWKNEAGAAQRVAFTKPADISAETKSVPLQATADSGLPVEFLVQSGPAEIEADGRTLAIKAIPPRAKFPVKVTVLAYQWGRSIAPLVQSAVPVEQSFLIEKK